MTIGIYLIRIIVSLLFAYLTLFNIASIYAHISKQWDKTNKMQVYTMNVILGFMWFLSFGALWSIQ